MKDWVGLVVDVLLVELFMQESILALSFSNKVSRYICSGGSGQVVRIWDLQRKRCIKWLRGHSSTITGAMYNCKDEHLASISVDGDLILHNLTSGARTAELKDPNGQVVFSLHLSADYYPRLCGFESLVSELIGYLLVFKTRY